MTSETSPRGRVVRPVVTVLVLLVVFALAGAAGGWLWHHLWDAPAGTAYKGAWYPDDETSLGGMFDATGLYVIIGFVAGLALGILAALAARRGELAALLGVVAGSVLAAWLSYRVGTALGPPDPAVVAAHAANGTHIPQQMSVPGHSPYLVWPLGALLGAGLTFLFTSAVVGGRRDLARRESEDPRWLTPAP